MKKMTLAEFQEGCVAVLDKMDSDGILITKNGKPIAKILPARPVSSRLIGSLKKKIRVKGNILSTGLSWNAQS